MRRLLPLVAVLAGAVLAAAWRSAKPPAPSAAIPRATDPMRPKVWDFPGPNKW